MAAYTKSAYYSSYTETHPSWKNAVGIALQHVEPASEKLEAVRSLLQRGAPVQFFAVARDICQLYLTQIIDMLAQHRDDESGTQ